MRRTLLAVCLVAVGLLGCATARVRDRTGNAKAHKDCAACARMCEVAGDAKSDPGGVNACQDDCARTCE